MMKVLEHCEQGFNRTSLLNGVILWMKGGQEIVDSIRSKRPDALFNQNLIRISDKSEMSLIIAFTGTRGAVMAGDMREITFQGDKDLREKLEQELYSGAIATDEELGKRAEELGVKITVRDDKSKVTQRHGALVGEVASVEDGIVRKRRVYASADSYVIADIIDAEIKVSNRGGGTAFIVLGNNITKEIANRTIRDNWKNGNLSDAIKVLIVAMETAAKMTASVSKKFILIKTDSKADLSWAMDRDNAKCKK